MNEEETAYMEEIEQKSKTLQNQTSQLAGVTNSMYAGQQDTNLIEWQLELDNILDRIQHLLAGDIVAIDETTGTRDWAEQPDKRLRPLNKFGVQFVMKTISFYINRNTILSTYDQDRIKAILNDLGHELTDQIGLRIEEMGLDDPEKRKYYPMLVLNIMHQIENTYNRAFKGGERDSLRSARVVTQTDPMQRPVMNSGNPGGDKGGWGALNPKNWV